MLSTVEGHSVDLGVRIDFRIDIYSEFRLEKFSFWIYSENYFEMLKIGFGDNIFNEINQK